MYGNLIRFYKINRKYSIIPMECFDFDKKFIRDILNLNHRFDVSLVRMGNLTDLQCQYYTVAVMFRFDFVS